MFPRLSSKKSAAFTFFYLSIPRKRRRESISFSLRAARLICLWGRPSLRLVSVNCGTSSVYRGRSFTNVPDSEQDMHHGRSRAIVGMREALDATFSGVCDSTFQTSLQGDKY